MSLENGYSICRGRSQSSDLGGRLAAGIQAVVAAGFVRNLREETRKEFVQRLEQGLWPLRATWLYAIRGFHRPRQEATPVPPILYKRTTTSAAMMRVETDVSNRLIAVVEELLKEREKNEDGSFLGINCTLALIRWLPKRLDLARIEALLRHPQTSWQMKQNLFLALFHALRDKHTRSLSEERSVS